MKIKRKRKRLIKIINLATLILAMEICLIMAFEIRNNLVKVSSNTQIYKVQEIMQEETTEPKSEVISQEQIAESDEAIKEDEIQFHLIDSVEEIILSAEQEETKPSLIAYDQEFQDRCRINYAESGGECLEGQIAVAAVIKNREESELFPDTFYDVINQSGQFSAVSYGEICIYGKIIKYEEVTEETIEAVERALKGEDPTEQLLWDEAVRLGLDPVKYAEGGALFFYNPYICGQEQLDARAYIRVKVQIGNHVFYKVWG